MEVVSLFRWFFSVVFGAVLLAGCTTTSAPSETATDMFGNVVDVTSGFISSSSPDSIFDDSAKAREFTHRNFARIKFNMAVGSGEHVSALGTLLHVPAERQSEFCRFTQKHFAVLYPHQTISSAEMLIRLNREMALHFYSRQDLVTRYSHL
jgi:hypothetical protein